MLRIACQYTALEPREGEPNKSNIPHPPCSPRLRHVRSKGPRVKAQSDRKVTGATRWWEQQQLEQQSGDQAPVFDDLHNHRDSKVCRIADPAERAISLAQLEGVGAHVRRRFANGDTWERKHLGDITIDDVSAHVCGPATKAQECSIVELMAEARQPPHYYCSYWSGDSVIAFIECVKRHTIDRGLEKRTVGRELEQPNPMFLGCSPCYWIQVFAAISNTDPNRNCNCQLCLHQQRTSTLINSDHLFTFINNDHLPNPNSTLIVSVTVA